MKKTAINIFSTALLINLLWVFLGSARFGDRPVVMGIGAGAFLLVEAYIAGWFLIKSRKQEAFAVALPWFVFFILPYVAIFLK